MAIVFYSRQNSLGLMAQYTVIVLCSIKGRALRPSINQSVSSIVIDNMKSIVLLSLLSLTAATPLARRDDLCDQYATVNQGDFTLYNNLWGKDQADNGSQCTGLDSVDDNTIAWHSTWTWQGGEGQVKSFPNAAYQVEAKTLDSVQSMTTKWEWRYPTLIPNKRERERGKS